MTKCFTLFFSGISFFAIVWGAAWINQGRLFMGGILLSASLTVLIISVLCDRRRDIKEKSAIHFANLLRINTLEREFNSNRNLKLPVFKKPGDILLTIDDIGLHHKNWLLQWDDIYQLCLTEDKPSKAHPSDSWYMLHLIKNDRKVIRLDLRVTYSEHPEVVHGIVKKLLDKKKTAS